MSARCRFENLVRLKLTHFLPLRLLAAVLVLVVISGCKRDRELSETLAWMDNTYNPRANPFEGSGHGKMHVYTPTDPKFLAANETFTEDGCSMVLRLQDDPSATISRSMYSNTVIAFNLRNINPQSVKTTFYNSRFGDNCESPMVGKASDSTCDYAEIAFVTHSEAPLIDEEMDTFFPELKGSEHHTYSKSKVARAYFWADDDEYAGRFAKAFIHAVELCGGRPEPF